ncbi:phage head-tail joining protein [Azospirillum argentinense]|uniref:GpW protein n=1 Tax=Azospirillum argentinense TaxID=2970906 RepID=A0A5B0KL67_9PROT|nr:hypothetical protein [Azospirillum argentinense]KAA1052959.1 hypothetical protein FH063_003366 [Azospirillum argentinense]
MATLAQLTAYRDALEAARYSGNRRVQTGATSVEFKTDAEMLAALNDLNRQIAAASDTPIRQIRISSSKGL